MTTLYLYRVRCIAEDAFVYVWGDTPPTMCPNDHPDRSIDPNATVIIRTISANEVVVSNDVNINVLDIPAGNQSVQGLHRMGSKNIFASANSSAEIEFSFPFPTGIVTGTIKTTADMEGNTLTAHVNRNTAIGTLTVGALTGAITVIVSPETLLYVKLGTHIKLDDGVNQTPFIMVIAVNELTNELTLETGIGYDFAIGTTVRYTLLYIDIEFGPAGEYVLGRAAQKGTYVPKNAPITLIYGNNSSTDGTLKMILEYRY